MLEHDYAAAIVALQSEGVDADKIAVGLARVLKANGHEKLLTRIERALTPLEAKRARTHTVTLTLAREHDARALKDEITQAAAQMQVDASAFTTKIDDSIVGGYVLTSGTQQIDASYKHALITLYRAITATQ